MKKQPAIRTLIIVGPPNEKRNRVVVQGAIQISKARSLFWIAPREGTYDPGIGTGIFLERLSKKEKVVEVVSPSYFSEELELTAPNLLPSRVPF